MWGGGTVIGGEPQLSRCYYYYFPVIFLDNFQQFIVFPTFRMVGWLREDWGEGEEVDAAHPGSVESLG